ncbi:protoporphyrinogen oxidase [Listeria sp. PSOL-1]|uniref:protoporphyrinogen oxidase n=1 Tax=Listeria sp. PSOL-1 TaxID=1844999 RepID=UPI0013D1EDBA|nr:protoporphyrinogen oxidase [Listeria sp. PSOL-1]
MKRIMIIGGGLSGLAAAYTLEKAASNQLKWDLYESHSSFGGKFETVKREGFIVEKGPDSFLARKPAGLALIEELGLTDKLIVNATGQSFVYHEKQLHPIPEGSVMGIPTDEAALLKSTLISEIGKKRALMEATLPYQSKDEDQSLGEFFEARFGSELVKCLIEPLLSGIYAGDIFQMSLRATFPQFEQAIEKAGSLMKGLKVPQNSNMNTTNTKNTIGAFRTLEGGFSELPAALVSALPKEHLHSAKKAKKITKKGSSYSISFTDGTKEEADYVLVAATHDTLIELTDEKTAAPFVNQPLTTLATISLAYDRQADLPEGTGYLVARTKPYKTTACTWVAKKWPHMVPKDKMLLRGFIGKMGEDEISGHSDDTLIDFVIQDYKEMMGLTDVPLFAEVSRMAHAMPTYKVGHKERLLALTDNLRANYPGVYFAGMSYVGIGIPDCIDLAQNQARQIINEVEN